MVHILTKLNSSKLKIIKILAIILFLFSIGIKFSNLSKKAYNADEVRGLYRLSGYTRQEIIDENFNGDIIEVSELQYYQVPNSSKTLNDAIESLSGNPEHTPLYYLIARFWMQITQNPVSSRVASVAISLLMFPCIYWLCRELFDNPLSGWISIILIAISPYHILLAQGAREYSLWALATILASSALLKARRVKTTQSWIIYGITLVIGFYSHLFFIIVAFVHGIYIACVEHFKFTKTSVSYILTSLLGVFAFSPWIFVIINNIEEVEKKTVWVRNATLSINKILKVFSANLGNVFIDFNDSTRLENLFDTFIVALSLYSLYFLIKKTSWQTWLLIVLLIVITAMSQFLPDLILQGKRSSQARYFVPCYIGIQIAVAYLIASYLSYKKFWRQCLGAVVLSFFVLTGIFSGSLIANTNDWDYLDQGNTANAVNIQLAPFINSADKPLVISEATHSFILGLSYLVDEDVKFQLLNDKNLEQWTEKIDLDKIYSEFSDIFVYFPDKQLSKFLDQKEAYQRENVFDNKLYKISKKAE